MFAGLYIACQSQQGNLEDFFKHENSSSPPSLAVHGKLRHGQKADLLDCFEVESQELQRPSVVDAKVLDATAVVNMPSPGRCKTFHEYKTNVFLPYVATQAHNVQRVDLVWDRYLDNSLKRGNSSSMIYCNIYYML